MTAHRRGHLLRAAVVGALVSGAVLLPAVPALADVNAQPGALTLKPGEEKTINVTVSDLGPGQNPQATVAVNGLGNDVTVRGPGGCQANGGGLRCAQNAFDRDGDDFKLAISVSHKAQTSVQQGQSKDGSIEIDAGGNNGDDSVNVTLQGPAQAASVTEVSGKVTDQSTGNGVPGAQVTLKDGAGKTHDATANSQGNYSIKPSANNPIAAGQVTITVSKENFADATATGNATAGKALNLPVRMKPTTASAEPSAPVASDPGPTEEASGAPADQATPQNASAESDGPSMLSWILIGMGILLVLLGIGAIVLLVMRRKDDTEGDEAAPYGTNPNMAPAGGGVYDRTMVGGGRSNANDQTAIVGPQQQLDEFPDPYAAPPAPTRVGGGAYSGGYDDTRAANMAPGGDYGNGGGYRDERGYGAQQGGYAEEPRGGYGGGGGYADQATGVYQGNGANGSEYGANGQGGGANGYGGGVNGYGGQGNGGANGYGPGGDGYEGDYGRRGGGDYEGDYGRRGGGDYQR